MVGERRIGRSSLLHAVYAQGPPRLPAAARCIHLDVQRVQHEGDFYARVLETLGLPGGTFRAREKAVADKPVLVCLDEFEQVTVNEAFSPDGLRSLAQDGLAAEWGCLPRPALPSAAERLSGQYLQTPPQRSSFVVCAISL